MFGLKGNDMSTKIQWCDEVWNPVTGCTKIREGCQNCYAERIAHRFIRIGTHAKHNIENYDTMDFNDVLLHYDRLEKPLHWRKPRKIFVCSMGDLFHKDVPFDFIEKVFDTIFDCSFKELCMAPGYYHTFIILTKRPDMAIKFTEYMKSNRRNTWFNNLWLGISVSTQKDLDEMIPILLQIPASKRIVSVEPCLSNIDLTSHKLSWVICGCESGQNRRHVDIDCIRNLRDQCIDAGVPFFLKQMEINGKVIHMPELDGHIYAEFPED